MNTKNIDEDGLKKVSNTGGLSEVKNKTALIKAISNKQTGNEKCLRRTKNLWRTQDLFGKQVEFTFKGKRSY